MSDIYNNSAFITLTIHSCLIDFYSGSCKILLLLNL